MNAKVWNIYESNLDQLVDGILSAEIMSAFEAVKPPNY